MELFIAIVLGGVIIFLGILNYVQGERHHKERQELLAQWDKERKALVNRLMSKDFKDYTVSKSYLENNIANELMEKLNSFEGQ